MTSEFIPGYLPNPREVLRNVLREIIRLGVRDRNVAFHTHPDRVIGVREDGRAFPNRNFEGAPTLEQLLLKVRRDARQPIINQVIVSYITNEKHYHYEKAFLINLGPNPVRIGHTRINPGDRYTFEQTSGLMLNVSTSKPEEKSVVVWFYTQKENPGFHSRVAGELGNVGYLDYYFENADEEERRDLIRDVNDEIFDNLFNQRAQLTDNLRRTMLWLRAHFTPGDEDFVYRVLDHLILELIEIVDKDVSVESAIRNLNHNFPSARVFVKVLAEFPYVPGERLPERDPMEISSVSVVLVAYFESLLRDPRGDSLTSLVTNYVKFLIRYLKMGWKLEFGSDEIARQFRIWLKYVDPEVISEFLREMIAGGETEKLKTINFQFHEMERLSVPWEQILGPRRYREYLDYLGVRTGTVGRMIPPLSQIAMGYWVP